MSDTEPATMTTYRIVYEIDIEAESPEAAAAIACDIIQDPDGLPPIFEITPWRIAADGFPEPPADTDASTTIDMTDIWPKIESL